MSGRTLVIGDIHGCIAEFESLLDATKFNEKDHLILLGDYIDRGPDSAGIIRKIISLSTTNKVTAIRGNHEVMMQDARDAHSKYTDWVSNGGDETLKSYGGVRGTLKDVPKEHWDFIANKMVDYLETKTHIYVHAGALPQFAMDEQPENVLRWERCDNIQPHDSRKVIVCGHTPQIDGRPMNKGFAICLDTNTGRGGPLTCMEVETGNVWQANEKRKVTRSNIREYLK